MEHNFELCIKTFLEIVMKNDNYVLEDTSVLLFCNKGVEFMIYIRIDTYLLYLFHLIDIFK